MREGTSGYNNSQGQSLDMAIDLIGGYIRQLREGGCPDPEDCAAHYKGQDRDTFRLQLYFSILMENTVRPIGEKRLNKILPPERREELSDDRFYEAFRSAQLHEVVMGLDLFHEEEDRIMAELEKKSGDFVRQLLSGKLPKD